MSKARGAPPAQPASVSSGDLVFIKSDGDKNRSRDLYLVMSVEGCMATLQKLRGSKFLSRRYEVPLTDLFHAITPRSDHQLHRSVPDYSSSSSSDDESSSGLLQENRPPTPQPDEEHPTDELEANQPLPRHSTRVRNPPAWFTSGEWTQ